MDQKCFHRKKGLTSEYISIGQGILDQSIFNRSNSKEFVVQEIDEGISTNGGLLC